MKESVMPSVFPAMAPFLVAHDWEDFHANLIAAIQAALIPLVRPRYSVRIEKRRCVESRAGSKATRIRADIAVFRESKSNELAPTKTFTLTDSEWVKQLLTKSSKTTGTNEKQSDEK